MASRMLKACFIFLLSLSFVGLSTAGSKVAKTGKKKTQSTWKIEKHVVAVLETGESSSEESGVASINMAKYLQTGTVIGTTTDGRSTSYMGRSIAVGSDGIIHAIWGDRPNNRTFYSQSTDSGKTWSQQAEVQGDLFTRRRGPAIAVDPNNPSNVFITFCACVTIEENVAVYFRKSTDGGFTWGDPVKIDASSHDPTAHDLIVDHEGTVHAVFDNGTDEHTYYNFSTDGGVTWLGQYPYLADLGHPGLASFGGCLAVDYNGNVHVLFGNDGNAGYWGDKNMYYNYREKGNNYFSEVPPVQLTFDEGCLGWGTLVVDSKNNVHAWYDNGRTMEYKIKDASGWSDPVEIPRYDPEKGGQMGMCSAAVDANDILYVIYKDGSTPNGSGQSWDRNMDVFCGTNKSGEWQYVNVTRLDASVPLNYPDIAREILDDGVVHLIYTENPSGEDDDPNAKIIYERAYPWPPEPTCSVRQLPDTYTTTGTFKVTAGTEDIDGVVVGSKLFVMKNGQQIGEYDMTELEQDSYEAEFTIDGVVGDTISYYGQAVDNDDNTGDSPLLSFIITQPVNPNVDLLVVRDDEKLVSTFWDPLLDSVKTADAEKYNYEVWDISAHNGIDASVTNFGWKTILIHGWVITSVPTRSYEGNGYAAFLNAGTAEAPVNLCLASQDYFYGAGETGTVDLAFEPGDFAYDFFQIAGGVSDPRENDQIPDSLLLGTADDPISGSFAEEPLRLRHDISGQDQWLDYTSAVDLTNDIFLLYNLAYGSGVKYDGGTFKTMHLPWLMCDLVKYQDPDNGDSTIVPQDEAYVLMKNILHWFGTKPGEGPNAVDDNPDVVVTDFALEQNYPNPFNPSTNINYAVPKSAHVEIIIYNSLGRKIKTLVNKKVGVGRHTIEWNGTDKRGLNVTSGIYFYKIKADNFSKTHKMLLLK